MLSSKIILLFLGINIFTQTLCKKKYVIGSSKSDNFNYQYDVSNDRNINNYNVTEDPNNQNLKYEHLNYNESYQNILNNSYQIASNDIQNQNVTLRPTNTDRKSTYENSRYNAVENEIYQNYNKGYSYNYTTTNQSLNVLSVINNSFDNTTNNNTYDNLYNNFASNINKGYYNLPNNSVTHGFYDSYSTVLPYDNNANFSKVYNTNKLDNNTNPNANNHTFNNTIDICKSIIYNYITNRNLNGDNTNTYNPDGNNLVDNYNTTKSKRCKKKREPIPIVKIGCIIFCQNSNCPTGYTKKGGYCMPDVEYDYE